MKEGLYRIEKILNNRIVFDWNETKEGNLVSITKAPYIDVCAVCGKPTQWTLTDEFEMPIGPHCLQKSCKLVKVK